ncbi:NACHT domain-containing protein [Moorena producens JHB]|uniref:NACHT domain-containing protein n=1 Tax=Moorena producens (strain JHB) TaxID=1454205 RepID=A0A1D9G5W1_MOOP1|nr:NACHT domain-containing protein [Moorena producens]AOY82996.1 NACHT domain-containing protein [Moorena producens JHB]
MSEPPSHDPNSQHSQPEPSVQQRNSGSSGVGQQAAGTAKGIFQFQWIGNTFNFFFGGASESFTPQQEEHNRKALLAKVKNYWIKGVLEKSLYHQVLIELGLEERPDAIPHPLSEISEIDEDSPQPLREGTKVIEIFDKIGTGATLLILGEPGSGKTTTLLKLAQDLIARAEQDTNQLIPVVFNLSYWTNKRDMIPDWLLEKVGNKSYLPKEIRETLVKKRRLLPFADWLVEELGNKYDVPNKIGKTLVKKQRLLPLLDGLDEVKVEYRDDCIATLNKFKQDYGAELVVCSRIKDYEALSNRLNFQQAVYIRLLTSKQVGHYLDSFGDYFTGLRTLIKKDKEWKKLAQSPLMLNIMTLAYQGVAVEDLPRIDVVEERRKQLFDAYIKKMFKRRKTNQRYKKAQVKHWLIWMAQRMVEESQTVFLIEKMQPYWLVNIKQKRIYRLMGGLMAALMFGLMAALMFGLMAALMFGLMFGLIFRLEDSEIETKITLNQGIRKSLCNAITVSLKVWLMVVLTGGLMGGLMGGLTGGLTGGLMVGLIEGLFLGLMNGGQACIQHFSLRLVLYFNNCIPWNYARFLDYAADRIFLQKVGGGYIFIHRMLMEHFAEMKPEN